MRPAGRKHPLPPTAGPTQSAAALKPIDGMAHFIQLTRKRCAGAWNGTAVRAAGGQLVNHWTQMVAGPIASD